MNGTNKMTIFFSRALEWPRKATQKSAAQSIKKDGTRKYLKMDATDSKSINESQNLWYILLRASTQHANKLRHQDRPKCRQIALRRGGEMVPNEGNERGMGRINPATNHGVWEMGKKGVLGVNFGSRLRVVPIFLLLLGKSYTYNNKKIYDSCVSYSNT